jgi:hypothetical protein
MLLPAQLRAALFHHSFSAQRLTLRLTGAAQNTQKNYAKFASQPPVEPFVRREHLKDRGHG